VVIATDIYHLKLFYRKSDGTVKFTEYESGVGWRSTPLILGSPPSSGGISSELSAVARDENHIAVFGVSANNTLWVKDMGQHQAVGLERYDVAIAVDQRQDC